MQNGLMGHEIGLTLWIWWGVKIELAFKNTATHPPVLPVEPKSQRTPNDDGSSAKRH